MEGVAKENFIPVHGKAEIYIGSLKRAPEELVEVDAENANTENTDAENNDNASNDTMAVEANVIVIYVDGRAYEIDLDDPENKEALSPSGENLKWLKGKLVDPNDPENGQPFALGIDPAKLQQALTKGLRVPEHLKDLADPAQAAGQMMVVEKALEPIKKPRETGPAFIDIVSGEVGVKVDEITGKERMHYRTDMLATGMDTAGGPVEDLAPGRGKGWKNYSLAEVASLSGASVGTAPISSSLTGSALAAVADIRGAVGQGFSAQSVTLNDVGSNVVNSGEVAANIEKQRSTEFANGPKLPGAG